jgi:predicted phage tail protein
VVEWDQIEQQFKDGRQNGMVCLSSSHERLENIEEQLNGMRGQFGRIIKVQTNWSLQQGLLY